MYVKRKLGLALAFLGTVTLLAGCEQPFSEPVRIGINPWPGYEYLYLAQELGFYRELGVPVKIIEYGSLGDVRRGYERGNLDAMATTLIEVLQVRNNSARNPCIFLVADFSDGGDVIIARKPIESVADLKGKRIAADTVSLPIFLLTRALETAGLSLDNVELVPMEQSEIEQAFAEGEIDAAVAYPPASVNLSGREDADIIFSSRTIPGEIMDVISAEASVLAERRADFKKIMQAWDMALGYAAEYPVEANRIMAKREGIMPGEFAEALKHMHILSLDQQSQYLPLVRPTLRKVRDVLVKTKVLSEATPAEGCLVTDLE